MSDVSRNKGNRRGLILENWPGRAQPKAKTPSVQLVSFFGFVFLNFYPLKRSEVMLLFQCENLENKRSLNKMLRPCKKMGLDLSFLTYSWSKKHFLSEP